MVRTRGRLGAILLCGLYLNAFDNGLGRGSTPLPRALTSIATTPASVMNDDINILRSRTNWGKQRFASHAVADSGTT